IFINQAKRLFSRKPKSNSNKNKNSNNNNDNSDEKGVSSGSSIVINELEITHQNETRLDVFAKGLDKKDPVTIKVEGLYLFVYLSKFSWTWSGIKSWIKREKQEKLLLKDVDVVFPEGQLTAILGGSGAGKTSLLNALLHRSPANVNMKGSI